MRLFLAVIMLFVSGSVATEPLHLGISNATSGSAAELGKDLNQGAQLYFSTLKGIPLNSHYKDDGYEPNWAINNTREFAREGTQLLFNYLGTPTAKAVFNFVHAKNMALITPFSGADFLRQAQASQVFNLRASYQQEIEYQVNYLVEQLQLVNIAVVIQADDFGLAVEKYLVQALRHHGIKPKFIAKFRRNSNEVMKAAKQVQKAQLEAVMFIGPYEPMATMINKLQPHNTNLVFSTVSFASSDRLLTRIPSSTKVLITEVVPDPKQCQFILCQQFRRLANEQQIRANHGSFEGFLNAYWLISAVQKCQPKLVPTCITEILERQPIYLLGQQRKFHSANRQLLNQVFATTQNLPDFSQ